jgi:hypothetical protein
MNQDDITGDARLVELLLELRVKVNAFVDGVGKNTHLARSIALEEVNHWIQANTNIILFVDDMLCHSDVLLAEVSTRTPLDGMRIVSELAGRQILQSGVQRLGHGGRKSQQTRLALPLVSRLKHWEKEDILELANVFAEGEAMLHVQMDLIHHNLPQRTDFRAPEKSL